jgi:hypothetical protein
MCASTRKALREGDTVCIVGGLLFDSLDRLRELVNTNEHAKEFWCHQV